MKNYELILKEHSLKVTPQRLGMLSIIDYVGHITIEELFANIRKDFCSISIATLYKNINSMVEVKILKEIKISNSKSKYEILKNEHSHMVCKKCEKLEDLNLCLDITIENASKKSGYIFDENALVLFGICPECQR
ncbi:Fur family transcriptional regulator [Sulfurimonas sp.]|jgi:Fur family peroxide stress response transcriptional regulator|uniref:Fur family transcriptional regulator n=1 Tax=Sulfurimonas sp. TaxID=2022749 RepID=UPI0025FDCFFC|nr:Fur family transcriptional regulator [Sulfurimonas sp.]MCK9472161.1 transcriptional repressor [Sulfurimonas sp.]